MGKNIGKGGWIGSVTLLIERVHGSGNWREDGTTSPGQGRSTSSQNDPGSPATDHSLKLCDDSERQPSS